MTCVSIGTLEQLLRGINWKLGLNASMNGNVLSQESEYRRRLYAVCSIPPALLELNSILELLAWYERSLCQVYLDDPRGFRVRFLPSNFVHLVQLKDEYGKEPKNKGRALEEIRAGEIVLRPGQFNAQRTQELSWACEIAARPNCIVRNWQSLGVGAEAYIKNFGVPEQPRIRVLVCKIVGERREVVTIFPRNRITEDDLREVIWP